MKHASGKLTAVIRENLTRTVTYHIYVEYQTIRNVRSISGFCPLELQIIFSCGNDSQLGDKDFF